MSAWRQISDCLPAWLSDAEFERGERLRESAQPTPGPARRGGLQATGLGNLEKGRELVTAPASFRESQHQEGREPVGVDDPATYRPRMLAALPAAGESRYALPKRVCPHALRIGSHLKLVAVNGGRVH